ncbi:AP-4 complex subunit epsilon-1 [Geodia barretti]|uniref:AP-4 complex subunit epsilon-1 n=1 Tax=Geodia barretti TaxID=519541 RepID=A0AA35TMR6_GEOBA|nr:AP-4 complex subunit epsilon-1 [Geodia barretti]
MEQTARVLSQLGSKDQPSKEFQSLVRQIGEAKTKHEEDRIIKKEAALLKDKVGGRDVTKRQMREYLIRLIYCEMLGVECSWGYIHAVKFTQTGSTLDKRIGYLAASLFLHEGHELNVLLVATLQKDLKSSNMLEVSMALVSICKLVGADMIPPLLPLVQDKLLHPKQLVRKKAVMAMHRFLLLSPDSISHLEDDFRRSLSDQDPGVMEAALILFHDLIKNGPIKYKDLTESFAMILTQVIDRKLPEEFNYHGVPAPWMQMRLLRILALLGADDLRTSEKIYPVVERVIGSAECNSDIGQAISYECIKTVATIYPNNSVVSTTAKCLSRFVTSTNNDWRYLGINGLASLVQVNPKYAQEHQMVVIDCLDDPDDTLRRKTLDLLYKMTNPLNVVVITEKLIGYLRQTRDEYIRADLVSKVTQLAERFAPDNIWFIQTMNAIFELGGNLVRREVAHNLMRLIAEGTDDERTDVELRQDAVSNYIELLDKPNLPDILIKIICWVVGEYSYVLEDTDTEEILEKITRLLMRTFEDKTTTNWVVSSVTKLVARLGSMPDNVQSQVAVYLASTDTDVQQRCNELLELSQNLSMMQTVLPLDSACEDLEVDSSLSFLDDFVTQSLAQGASRYKPPHLRPAVLQRNQAPQAKEIRFEEYPMPAPPSFHRPAPLPSSPSPSPRVPRRPSEDSPLSSPTSARSQIAHSVTTAPSGSLQYAPSELSTSGIAVKTQRVWGNKGYVKEVPSVPVATPPIATTTTSPQQPVTVATREGEEGEEEGGSERSERSGESPSKPITAAGPLVSFPSMLANCMQCENYEVERQRHNRQINYT